MLSTYSINLLNNSTSCNKVELEDGLIGIYNGLSFWGRVEDGKGKLVAELAHEMEMDEDGSAYQPNFTSSSFEEFGYRIRQQGIGSRQ
jgi:hypothetical protein